MTGERHAGHAHDRVHKALEDSPVDQLTEHLTAALYSPLPRPVLAVTWEDVAAGEPYLDRDGNLWKELVLDDDGVISARDTEGRVHQWGTAEQMHRAVLRVSRLDRG